MKLKKKLAVLLCVLLAFSVCVTIVSATAPDLDPRTSVSTMDIVEAYSKSTSLKGIRDDSWSKKITVTGYDGSDHEQYCTIRVGFDDGIFSNKDWMITSPTNADSGPCDTATGIYICGCIVNDNGATSWTGWKTNMDTCYKITKKHSGKAYYYVAFSD